MMNWMMAEDSSSHDKCPRFHFPTCNIATVHNTA